MPEEEYSWLPREDILSLEEMARLVRAFAKVGVSKVRFTGGEPLLRKNFPELIQQVAAIPGVEDLALTTNAMLLASMAETLQSAGIRRLNISLDTLDRARFQSLTRRDALPQVLEGIQAAKSAGFKNTKLDTVLIRGTNEDEILSLLEFAAEEELQLRFIEYMDVGGATQWSKSQVVSREEILQVVSKHYGKVETITDHDPSAPARLYRLPQGLDFGIIASTTTPFCSDCDRVRVTADGTWFSCLYAQKGTDLRDALRDGRSDANLAQTLHSLWGKRSDRGAEQRLSEKERGPAVSLDDLLADPLLEMHTRGG